MNQQFNPSVTELQPALGMQGKGKPAPPLRRWLRYLVVYSILGLLLYFALRNAPFAEIWNALKSLQLSQIGLLLHHQRSCDRMP